MAQSTQEENIKSIPCVDIVQLQGSELTAELEKNRVNDILIYIFGAELKKTFHSAVKEHCYGCQTEHPSQLHHLCLFLEDDDCEVDEILREALAKIDITYVKAVYVETAAILKLDATWSLTIFDHLIKGLQNQWEQMRRFGVVVTAINNMSFNFGYINDLQALKEAVNAAREKVDKLEKRFNRSSSKD